MIRKANVKDLTYLVNLAVLLWPKHTYEKLEEELRNILNSSRDGVYLYEEGEKAIGFSHCNLRYEYVEGTASKPVA